MSARKRHHLKTVKPLHVTDKVHRIKEVPKFAKVRKVRPVGTHVHTAPWLKRQKPM